MIESILFVHVKNHVSNLNLLRKSKKNDLIDVVQRQNKNAAIIVSKEFEVISTNVNKNDKLKNDFEKNNFSFELIFIVAHNVFSN